MSETTVKNLYNYLLNSLLYFEKKMKLFKIKYFIFKVFFFYESSIIASITSQGSDI